VEKHSKRYRKSQEKAKAKEYKIPEAVEVVKSFERAKFVESVDLAFNLNVDTKQSDQMVRGTVSLPHGTGKEVKVAVFSRSTGTEEAKKAGADFIGADDLMEKVKGGWLDFDVAVATPDMMKDLSKLGKILGPKGLMPSPKAGTVTTDVLRAIKEIKKGKVEYKVDKAGNVHLSIGKISFENAQLAENAQVVIEAVARSKPPSVKGNFIKSIALSSTMSPAVRLDVRDFLASQAS